MSLCVLKRSYGEKELEIRDICIFQISDELNYPVKCKSTVPCNEYKLLAVMQTSDQNAVALAVIADQVVAVSLHYKMRQNSSNASTTSSDSSGCEDNSLNSSMTMLAPMTTGIFSIINSSTTVIFNLFAIG